MGNGDLTLSVGSKPDGLRYYLSKNDFWRLRSKADGLSGPRVVGLVDIQIDGIHESSFTAEQSLENGVTTCSLVNDQQKITAKSWVSATNNLIFIELTALNKGAQISIRLTAPENKHAQVKQGKVNDTYWLSRAFADSVDIATEVAIALRSLTHQKDTILLPPGGKVIIALAVESKFKKKEPLAYVLKQVIHLNSKSVEVLKKEHDAWWRSYWNKSAVWVEDTVLMKAYYQGLYTMAACSRDPKFPPGIFGWITNDTPAWNGDYDLNYNFQAPFYGLYAANRLEQGEPHDAPLLDFMQRGA